MSGLVIAGWGAVSAAGVGAGALVDRLAGVDLAAASRAPGIPVGQLYDEPLPAPLGHALTGFDVRAELGRKGTGAYDRATALAVVCCGDALRNAGDVVGDDARARTGVALGTSLGSFKSTSDFSRETLVQDKPYLVNPLLFPNTVMNCAAGQVAIRFGLRGVNATIAGGTLAFLNALRYAANVIERGYADVVLAGAVEEYTPHRAWAGQLTGATRTVPSGEAAAVFVLAGAGAPGGPRGGHWPRILAVATGYGPGGTAGQALQGCVTRALRAAGADPALVGAVVTGETGADDRGEFRPATRALGREPVRIRPKLLFGECDAASGALALAALLAAGGCGQSGDLTVLTGRGPDGAVGAAIVQVSGDVGSDRG